jgi:hypothetical protein
MKRVIIGNLPGGGYGLKASLPGFDVSEVTDDDTAKLSFSSNWTNATKLHIVSIISLPVINEFGTRQGSIPFVALPYLPFGAVRGVSGTTIYDDNNTSFPGTGSVVTRHQTSLTGRMSSSDLVITCPPGGPFATALGVVYKDGF